MLSVFYHLPGLHELRDTVGLSQQFASAVAIVDPLNRFLARSKTARDFDRKRSSIPHRHTEHLYSLAGP